MQYQSFGRGLRQFLLWSCPCQCLDCILRPPICTRRTHWTASQLTILCGAGLKEGNAWTGKEDQLCKKVKILFSSHRLACSYASNSTTIASYSEKEVTKCLSFTIVKSFISSSCAVPNGYPNPTCYPVFFRYLTRSSFENHREAGNPKYPVIPDISCKPKVLGFRTHDWVFQV